MITQSARGGRGGERQLAKLYRSLAPPEQSTLLAFAEFLASRHTDQRNEDQGPLEPDPMPRPAEESVVAAIKRLSRSYFMLDRGAMLNDTSSLMGAHVLQGRPVRAVIDDLEALFARHYAQYRKEKERENS